MKLLHYINKFSPLSETFIYDVVVQLDEAGVSNIVLTNEILNLTERPYQKVIKIPVFEPNLIEKSALKLWNKINRDDTLKYRNKAFIKIIKQQNPDIIHAHFGNTGYRIITVAKHLKIPIVVSFHGFDAFKLPKDAFWSSKMREVFQEASMIIVVSAVMKDHLMSLGCPPDKLKIIHVGKKLKDYPFPEETPYQVRNFISIGRLVEKKGHEDAIKAFQKLLASHPELSLKIIGEGPMEEQLKFLIKDQQLQDHIELLGAVSHQATKRFLEQADAFILCSKTASDGDQEGIPTVLMEAQALGRPCVTTIHSGIPEVIPKENHWMLAEEANVDDIAAKIAALVQAPAEKVRAAVALGHEKVVNEFSLEQEVNKLVLIYHTLLKNKRQD